MKTSITLRMRITLLTGIVIAVIALLLTMASMLNARQELYSLSGTAMQIISEEKLETKNNPSSANPPLGTIPDEGSNLLSNREILIMQAELAARQRFNIFSIICLISAVIIGMLSAYTLAGRALLPVHELSLAASEINAENLHSRLTSSGMPDDIGSLINTFNLMLDRLANAFESQKRFSSNVAHELKTPLATMKMSVQVAQLETKDPADLEFFKAFERGANRLSDVVTSLLALSDETVVLFDDQINFASLLRKAVIELQPLYENKKLHIEYIFEVSELSVAGNRRLVQQLLNNLVENAMKYTPSNGTIWLSTSRRDSMLLVIVADNGAGIPEAALKHIFEPFYCVDASRSRKLGGAGLGLSIAYKVAEQHGWQLSAANAPIGGAVFTISIPLE